MHVATLYVQPPPPRIILHANSLAEPPVALVEGGADGCDTGAEVEGCMLLLLHVLGGYLRDASRDGWGYPAVDSADGGGNR